MSKPVFVVWEDGKPTSNDPKESSRLEKRMLIIDKVLKEMGYPDGAERYSEIVTELASKDFKKYMTMLDRVSEEAKRQHV